MADNYVLATDLDDSLDPLTSIANTMAYTSADTGASRDRAWIYGIVCGWDCEDTTEGHEHDADCSAAMDELAAKWRWPAEQVERLRNLRKAWIRLTVPYTPAVAPPAPLPVVLVHWWSPGAVRALCCWIPAPDGISWSETLGAVTCPQLTREILGPNVVEGASVPVADVTVDATTCDHDWTSWAETDLGRPRTCKKCGARNESPVDPSDPFEYRPLPDGGADRG